ncbi:unnamed protein product [Camellia sinensis]
MIHNAVGQQLLSGVKLSLSGPRVSHLFFADDSLVFAKASFDEAQVLMHILSAFEEASGQKVNLDKSSVFFSKNVDDQSKQAISHLLGVEAMATTGKYLGMPTFVGVSKREVFGYIKTNIWKRLNGWKEKFLSAVGRDILIKAVAQAIPVFIMSCFMLPVGLCHEIDSMISHFWWGQREEERKIHWLRWSKLCLPRQKGGLGFRSLMAFNRAMLAKQVWWLLKRPESLAAQLLKSRYFPNSSVLDASLGCNPSLTWRSIHGSRSLLQFGLRWRIGDGQRAQVWGDQWIPRPLSFRLVVPPTDLLLDALVSTLIDRDRGCWNEEIITSSFSPIDVPTILAIPLYRNWPEDTLVWHYSKNGIFSVKSAYLLELTTSNIDMAVGSSEDGMTSAVFWKMIWKLQIPSKIRVFAWKACLDILPVKANLIKKHIPLTDCYEVCGEGVETVCHCLFQCEFAKRVWLVAGLDHLWQLGLTCAFFDWIWQISSSHGSAVLGLVFSICWGI